MAQILAIETAKEHLFSSVDEMDRCGLAKPVQDRLLRLRDIYNFWLKFPDTKDAQVVHEIVRRYKVSRQTGYEDLRLIKALLGEMSTTTRDFHRYKFLQMIEQTFETAKRRNDAKAMAAASAAYGKFTQLDKEDPRELGYDKIIPQNFEITDDPAILGFKKIPDVKERINKLIKEMGQDIQDVQYEEVEFNEEDIFKLPNKKSNV